MKCIVRLRYFHSKYLSEIKITVLICKKMEDLILRKRHLFNEALKEDLYLIDG